MFLGISGGSYCYIESNKIGARSRYFLIFLDISEAFNTSFDVSSTREETILMP